MGLISRIFSHVGSGTSTGGYYASMNQALYRLNDEYTMLHYPFFRDKTDSFLKAQENLTDYCMAQIPTVKDKVLLEVGCGNGVQAMYIQKKYSPGLVQGIDLNQGNINIARKEAKKKGLEHIEFNVDNAHDLATIENDSVDFLVNIESAFHYPDKAKFLHQISRVLKPGGTFLIADILTKNSKHNRLKDRWKKKMSYHHWPLIDYEAALRSEKFENVIYSDITSQVIRGFRNYRNWFREMKHKHFLEDLFMKLYYTIHVRVNVYLLRTNRQYCVMVGRKF
jgi:ubiquinone/menaquinone biosynthesis C-methylase UbiE